MVLGQGQYANSRFYAARGKYSLLQTCNTWTARALRSAGLPITSLYAVSAGNVMAQTRPLGRRISEHAAKWADEVPPSGPVHQSPR